MSKLKQALMPKWPVQTNESDKLFNSHLETVINDCEVEEFSKLSQNLVDEKEEEQQDELKVFQDEEIIDDDQVTDEPVWLKSKENFAHKSKPLSKQTSVVPTPLAYSRSSSLTSLNSFDIKSIHSTVDSEYSHAPKNGDSSHLDEDDFDELMPDSPAAPDSSFLKAQRTIHKMNQAECRQNAFKISNDLNTFMSRLIINEPAKINPQLNTTPPVKLPKFLQSNPPPMIPSPQPQPVMSVTYGFLKNCNPILGHIAPQQQQQQQHKQLQTTQPNPQSLPCQPSQPPKFLLSSQNYQSSSVEDSPRVYSSIRLRPDSPQESVCSRMSDGSVPSLIRQDISVSNKKLNSVLNNNPNFKALFQKLNVPKNETSSSSSESSCSSVVPKLNKDLDEEEDYDENESSFLNTTTKPMNTPAGFASVSGSSFIADSNSEDQQLENDNSTNDACLYIDFDLENFIKENFQPNSNEALNTQERKFSKRASLQSLDFNSNKTSSKSSKTTSKKRLSEDNLKVSIFKKPEIVVSRPSKPIPAASSTSLTSANAPKPITKATVPMVQMNKTAQLRASKLSNTTSTTTSTVKNQTITKPIDRKPIVNTQSRVNRVIPSSSKQTTDRFNTTVNENEIKLLPDHVTQSSRRFSTSGTGLVKKEPSKKTVLSNLNKDLNSTIATSNDSKISSKACSKTSDIVKPNVSTTSRTFQSKTGFTKVGGK